MSSADSALTIHPHNVSSMDVQPAQEVAAMPVIQISVDSGDAPDGHDGTIVITAADGLESTQQPGQPSISVPFIVCADGEADEPNTLDIHAPNASHAVHVTEIDDHPTKVGSLSPPRLDGEEVERSTLLVCVNINTSVPYAVVMTDL